MLLGIITDDVTGDAGGRALPAPETGLALALASDPLGAPDVFGEALAARDSP